MEQPAPQGIGMAVAFDWGLTVQILLTPILTTFFGNSNAYTLPVGNPLLKNVLSFVIAWPVAIGIAFLIGGVFYIAFGSSRSFVLALLFLLTAHTGGSILWVFSTVLLQREVEDKFRGRVFAAELALLTLTMAASNYLVGELMDRFGFSPRVVTVGVGTFFVFPGLIWFLTRGWWDRKENTIGLEAGYSPPVVEIIDDGGR